MKHKAAKAIDWCGLHLPRWLPTGITAATCIAGIWAVGCWNGQIDQRMLMLERDSARLRSEGSIPAQELRSQMMSIMNQLTAISKQQDKLTDILLSHLSSQSRVVDAPEPNGGVY